MCSIAFGFVGHDLLISGLNTLKNLILFLVMDARRFALPKIEKRSKNNQHLPLIRTTASSTALSRYKAKPEIRPSLIFHKYRDTSLILKVSSKKSYRPDKRNRQLLV